MFTTLYINFSDVQGQMILVVVVLSGRNLNSSKLLCMSSLPARMRLITSKMKELECSQDFSHYKSMGIFPDAQGQLTPQSLVLSGRISNSSEMLWMSSLPASMKKIRSKIKVLVLTRFSPLPYMGVAGIWVTFGHVTQMPRKNFRFPYPRRLHRKFRFDWPSSFRGEDV